MLFIGAVTLDSDNPKALADFYRKLLGWERYHDDGEYIYISPGERSMQLIFQENADYQRPAWPTEREKQQQMIHLDFYTDDLEKEVKRAIEYGAKLAEVQYSDGWRVMIDPAGHPFCIVNIGLK